MLEIDSSAKGSDGDKQTKPAFSTQTTLVLSMFRPPDASWAGGKAEWLAYFRRGVDACEPPSDPHEATPKRQKRKHDCCDDPAPTLVPGYKGRDTLGCHNCTPRCPRCHEPAADLGYSTESWANEVCHPCAMGEHSDANSSLSEESSEEETSEEETVSEEENGESEEKEKESSAIE